MSIKEKKTLDVRTVNIDDLVDIRDVVVDVSLPEKEKRADYLRQVKNPNMVRFKNMVIQISHADTDMTMADHFENLIFKTN